MMINRRSKLPIDKDLFLSLISGSEAGIATTAAIIAGVVIGTDDRALVVASSLIAIIVQAFNSSVTHIYTSHTIDEIEHSRDMDSLITPMIEAGLQFITHLIAGLIVLAPIVYVVDLGMGLIISISTSLVLLMWIGFFVGRTLRHTPVRNSIHSFVLGALVIAGGFGAGLLIN